MIAVSAECCICIVLVVTIIFGDHGGLPVFGDVEYNADRIDFVGSAERFETLECVFTIRAPMDCGPAGRKRMVKAALRWGSTINVQNKQGQTPLHCRRFLYNIIII